MVQSGDFGLGLQHFIAYTANSIIRPARYGAGGGSAGYRFGDMPFGGNGFLFGLTAALAGTLAETGFRAIGFIHGLPLAKIMVQSGDFGSGLQHFIAYTANSIIRPAGFGAGGGIAGYRFGDMPFGGNAFLFGFTAALAGTLAQTCFRAIGFIHGLPLAIIMAQGGNSFHRSADFFSAGFTVNDRFLAAVSCAGGGIVILVNRVFGRVHVRCGGGYGRIRGYGGRYLRGHWCRRFRWDRRGYYCRNRRFRGNGGRRGIQLGNAPGLNFATPGALADFSALLFGGRGPYNAPRPPFVAQSAAAAYTERFAAGADVNDFTIRCASGRDKGR